MINLPLRLSSIIALSLASALIACQPKVDTMSPDEIQRVESLTANMTTRCVGRFLVDLPEIFILNSESRTDVEGVKINVKPMDKRFFLEQLTSKHNELLKLHMDGKPDRPVLKRIESTPTITVGMVFNRAEKSGSAEFARTLELWAWKDGYEIFLHINATDGTDIPFDETLIGTPFESSARRIWSEYKEQNDTPQKLAHLLNIYERVQGRKDTEIPTEPGLCIANGFVVGVERDEQDTGVVYHLANAPDVWIGITNDDLVVADKTLFQRAPEVERGMKHNQVKTLRKSARTIHGLPYEEWLFGNTPYQDEVRGTQFLLHGNETGLDPSRPYLKLAMYNGDRIPTPDLNMAEKDKLELNKALAKATLTDSAAIAIWDKITATLRPRPGA